MAAVLPFIGAIASVAGTLMAPSAPSYQQLPPAPEPLKPPPAPTVSSAEKAKPEPMVDTEAAQMRARKRAAADKGGLFNLTNVDESQVVTKSILGE